MKSTSFIIILSALDSLRLDDLRMLDWVGMIIYGSMPESLLQQISSLAMHFIWVGFLGIIFSYLFPDVSSKGFVGKAVIFSLIQFFAQDAIVLLYQVPNLAKLTTHSALSSQIGAIIWGITLGYVCRRLGLMDNKQRSA